MPRLSHVGSFLVGAVIATAAFSWAAPAPARPRAEKRFAKLDVFARVLSYVENNYVEGIDEQKLIYGAAKGMMRTLDPHSAFLTPAEFADLQADNEGEFGGVGLSLDSDVRGPLVLEVLPGTPAQKAGLLAGDRLVAVDGKPLGPDSLEVGARLRGRPGTLVSVSIERKGWAEPRTITITREIIQVKAVESLALSAEVAYIHIKQFQERTDQEVLAALEAHKKAHGRIGGLVLDLRGNPGGLLDQSIRVADLFLDDGVIVTTRGRGDRKLDEELAASAGTWSGFPIVVLVNGTSASAAEIVAGALQDHGRALLLGTRTYGKGSVQSLIPLEDGSGLKLTIARYYTPRGRSIQEKGIAPDFEVAQADPDKLAEARLAEDVEREEDLDGHLHNQAGRGAGHKPDRSAPATVAEATPAARRLARDHQLAMAFQTLRTHRMLAR